MSGPKLEPGLAPTLNWVSIDYAAGARDVSTKTIRRMIARGEIEARRFGPRLIRVSLASLEQAGSPIGGGH